MSTRRVELIQARAEDVTPFRFQPLVVEHGDQRVVLPRYRRESGRRRAIIFAGVHGREHGGIWLAHRLMRALSEVKLLSTFDIFPIANPLSFFAEARATPDDGMNLGDCFVPDPADSITEAMGAALLEEIGLCELLLDLHAAGEARYLPHVIVRDASLVEAAAQMGFHFVIVRRHTREGTKTNSLSALAETQQGFVVEAGGGLSVVLEDLEYSLARLMAFLADDGWIESEVVAVAPTPSQHLHYRDRRELFKAHKPGAFYPEVQLGTVMQVEQRIATWVPFDSMQPQAVIARKPGRVIYLRTRCWSRPEDTLYMTLASVPEA